MDVREFVASTLRQILRAVADVQPEAAALGGHVNPVHASARKEASTIIGFTPAGQPITTVEFDLAVLVATEKAADGGGQLKIASLIEAGGKAKASDRTESTSRVRFSIPITLPADEQSTHERAEQKNAMRDALAARRQDPSGVSQHRW